MDFHGLPRKQLQALCKQNKIPANMTNVTMADALASLDHVEGVGEVVQPQSARKAEAGSPEVPRTATRTSTRAKKLALESTGTVSLSGARTRKKLVDDDAVEEEKKEAGKTPAVASSRKRAPAAASRKKMEVPTMQKVYGTRRSVRLIENKLSEMCLGESGKRNQPIKIDDELSSEMTESEIKAESEMCEEKALDSDEVKYCQVSDQLVEAVDIADVIQVNEASNKDHKGVVVTEEVEKTTEEVFAEEAVGAMGDSYVEKDLKIVSDGASSLGTSEVSAQPVEAVDSTGVDQVNEVSNNTAGDIVVTGEVENAIAEDYAGEAVGAKGSADAGKDLKIANDGVSSLGTSDVSAQLVEVVDSTIQVNEVSSYGITDTVATEEGKKAASEGFADEPVEAMGTADAVKDLELASDCVSGLVAVEMIGKASPEKFVEKTFAVSEVASRLGSPEMVEIAAGEKELEIASEAAVTDLQVKEDVVLKSLADHENENARNIFVDLVTSDDLNLQDSTYAESHTEDVKCGVDEKETFECSVPKPVTVTVEVKPASEERIKMSPFSARIANLGNTPYPKPQPSLQRSVFKEALAIDYVNKENMVDTSLLTEESIKKPEMNYEVMSMRQLRKMVKAISISTPGDIEEDDNTTKDTVKQHTVRPRHALKRLPEYTQI